MYVLLHCSSKGIPSCYFFFPFTRLSVVDGIPERDPAACNLVDNIGLQDQAYSVFVFF